MAAAVNERTITLTVMYNPRLNEKGCDWLARANIILLKFFPVSRCFCRSSNPDSVQFIEEQTS